MRWLILASLLLLAACIPPELPYQRGVPEGLCQADADGAPLPAPPRLGDRGIGGTGVSEGEGEDRGIGGTGIGGVVSGFASICVGGLEVAYDTRGSGLRVGDYVLIDADARGGRLAARRLTVRQEVSGPVEAADAAGLQWRVAGQTVRADAATRMPRSIRTGDWVEVSGLRSADGTVQATRISSRDAGPVLVRGLATLTQGRWRMGGVVLRAATGTVPAEGFLTVRGRYEGGALDVEAAEPDPFMVDPGALFSAARRLTIEAVVSGGSGRLMLGAGSVAAAAGLTLPNGAPRRAVVDLERQEGGGFVATDLRMFGDGAGDSVGGAYSGFSRGASAGYAGRGAAGGWGHGGFAGRGSGRGGGGRGGDDNGPGGGSAGGGAGGGQGGQGGEGTGGSAEGGPGDGPGGGPGGGTGY